jgi:hypothetical protein
MSAQPWRYALASVSGTMHTRLDRPCQDASACKVLRTATGDAVLVAVAADGAGSAARAEVGAQLACALCIDELTALFATGGEVSDVTREFVHAWLTSFQTEIARSAEGTRLKAREFACTVLVAVVGASSAVCWQVGDGAIVVAAPGAADDYCWVFWPQHGEFANTTTFATAPEALEQFDYALLEGQIAEVALFTDGLERLALHFQSRSVHGPFFQPLFRALRASPEPAAGTFSGALAALLNSPQVNERSDDDKTLVLATRRPVAAHVPADGARDGDHDEPASL